MSSGRLAPILVVFLALVPVVSLADSKCQGGWKYLQQTESCYKVSGVFPQAFWENIINLLFFPSSWTVMGRRCPGKSPATHVFLKAETSSVSTRKRSRSWRMVSDTHESTAMGTDCLTPFLLNNTSNIPLLSRIVGWLQPCANAEGSNPHPLLGARALGLRPQPPSFTDLSRGPSLILLPIRYPYGLRRFSRPPTPAPAHPIVGPPHRVDWLTHFNLLRSGKGRRSNPWLLRRERNVDRLETQGRQVGMEVERLLADRHREMGSGCPTVLANAKSAL